MEGTQYPMPITVAGRVLSFDRRRRWDRYKNGYRRLTVWLFTVLAVFFGFDTLTQLLSAVGEGDVEFLVGVPIVVAGAVLAILFAAGQSKRGLRDLQTAWYNEQADQARLMAGIRIDLYDDRVVRSDLRSTVTLYYRELTAVTETADGILLQAGNREIVISGVDLTPWQVSQVQLCLREAAAAVYRLKKPTVGQLLEPLPIPVLTVEDTVISRGNITLSRPVPAEMYRRWQMNTVTRWVLPLAAVFGATLACWVALTDWFVVDLLLLVGGSMAIGVLLSLFGSSLGKRRTAVQLVVTRHGIGGFANGASDFLVWSRMRVRLTPQGLRLTLPDNVLLSIPWRCLEHPEAVQQLFSN